MRRHQQRRDLGLRQRGVAVEAAAADLEQGAQPETRGQHHPVLGAMRAQQRQHRLDHRRLGLLDVDVEHHAGQLDQQLLDGGQADALAGERPAAVGRDEAPAEIEALRLGEVDVLPGDVDVGHALGAGIVGHHRVTVAGHVDVELERVDADLERALERRQRVLGELGGGAAMSIETQGAIDHAALYARILGAMRRPMLALSALALVTALLAAPGRAAADGVTLVSGPAGDRDAIVASVEQVRSLMTVCWQRKPPASVKVTLAVAASGEVTKATARTKGPAAQCAAGLLAVSTLAATRKAWKGEVELASLAAGKAADVRAIHDQLAGHGPTFFACQQKEPAFVGKVLLRVTVGQDGAITAADGEVKEGGGKGGKAGKAVAACVAAAARKLGLDPITSPSVTYELQLSYSGGDAGGGGAAVATRRPTRRCSRARRARSRRRTWRR